MEVAFNVYEGTIQAEALGLVAAKTRASLMVEGKLPEEGLAALGGVPIGSVDARRPPLDHAAAR